MVPDLRIQLPHPPDVHLVGRCVEFLDAETREASVRPLGRYGYTNSRLYLVYCAPRDGGIPFVIKTDRRTIVEREAQGVSRLSVYFTGAQQARVFPHVNSPEAVIYPLVSVDSYESIRELRDVVYESRSHADSRSLSSVDLLRRTYESCRQAHVVELQEFSFGEQYKWYLRDTRERLLTDPIPAIFGRSETVRIYGYVLNDPRRILGSVKALETRGGTCAVHGDLHPNNVLFGPELVPVLIDYAFGHRNGHFVKDFVLMECSLRFLLPPKLTQPDVVGELDRLLLDEDGHMRADELTASGRTDDVIEEMTQLVKVIREECRLRLPSYSWSEYLIAQYLILMGNIRLLPYQDFRTLHALCMLADRIERDVL